MKQTRSPLLLAGMLIFPLFIGLSLLIAFISPGFSLLRHEISLLLVSPLGWLQTINFLFTGALGLLFSVGLWRKLHGQKAGTWGPILLAVYGIGFLLAGLFSPDPQLGYPAGAPADVPMTQTTAANIHSMAFSLLALAIVSAGFVFARRFMAGGKQKWGVYSIVNSLAIIVLVVLGSSLMASGKGGIFLLGVAIAISSWISIIACHFIKNSQ